jgi:hypothetical protein
MTDAEKIELLRAKLEETLSENDRLRALVERLTEGASAHATLQELHRDRNLSPAIRAKAAIGCLGVETPPLKPQPPAIDASCEEIIPLAELVTQRRAYADAMQREMRDIEVLRDGTVRVLPKPGSNGSGD